MEPTMNPSEPADDGALLDSAGPLPPESVEGERRRPDWSEGHPVVAADGHTWRLPRLDGAFLATHPDLAARLSRYARGTGGDLDDAEILGRIFPAMLAFGDELLAANYALDRFDRSILGWFLDPVAREEFVVAVSEALADGAEDAPGRWELFEVDSTPGSALTLFHN